MEWNVPDTKANRKKVITLLGERFRSHKGDLVDLYMKKGKSPLDKYKLSEDTWREFCEQRETPEWQV